MKDQYRIMSDDEPIMKDVPKLTKKQEEELEAFIKKTIEENK